MDEPVQPVDDAGEGKGAIDVVKDAASQVGDFVSRQIENVKEYMGSNEVDNLKSQLHEIQNILDVAERTMPQFQETAGLRLSTGLESLNDYRQRIKLFEEKLNREADASTPADKMDSLTKEWSDQLQNMYDSGLSEVITAVERQKPHPLVE